MDIPVMEPDRQYYFMNECKKLIHEKAVKKGRTLTYCVTTFGCQMNAHDSERLKGILDTLGYEETEDEKADFVVFNTCTVRENANLKLYGHLGHLKGVKAKNEDMVICLCGCMMQEPHVVEKIKNQYSFVDIVFGTHNIYKLAELIYMKLCENRQIIEILESADKTVEELPQKRKYTFKSGVNIMYGCNNFCTYCIVPYVRGRERSRKVSDILAECRALVSAGVKEIMLLGQNVNSYGNIYDYEDGRIVKQDLSEQMSFPELLEEVCKIDGLERVRFMTSHPKDLSDELIEVMAKEKKVCKHLHLPIQAGSTEILSKMNRRYTKEDYLRLVEKIRAAMPDISLTTDIMVGFPGETEEDFQETLDVVEKVGYDQAFTFIYSRRTGTPAAAMDNQIEATVVKERFSRLLERVNAISAERLLRFKDRVVSVIVEEQNHQDSSMVTGKTEENVTVHFKGDSELIGETISVKLVDCKGFYYIGERV